MNELEWIDFLRQKNKSKKNLLVGIGDDCALAQLGRERFLLKSDLFIEGVHFKRNNISLETVGERAVSRVLSDFAACGGSPKLIGISVGMPKNLKSTGLKKILDGVLRSAKKYKFSLVGGDTSRADKLFLDVWGLGVTDKFIARSTAKAGDYIFITGCLGQRGLSDNFIPRLKESKMLSDKFKVNSMIDISDGFIFDLYRLLKASKKGAILEKEAIPTTQGIKDMYRGEDYELLFTISKKEKNIDFLKKRFYYVGRITSGKYGYWLKDKNKLKRVKIKGYTHF